MRRDRTTLDDEASPEAAEEAGRALNSTLAQLVVRYYVELTTYIARRTGSATLAADILQDTWVRAALAKPTQPPANPRAYLYRVADNVAADHLRRDRGRVGASDETGAEDRADPQPGPERVAIAREQLLILAAAIRELPPRCREVFLLYRGGGLPMKAIARQLGISEKTVEHHIAKAMLHCRRRLADPPLR